MVKYSHILTFLWIFCIISLKWWCSSMGMANKIRVILIEKNMKIKDLAALLGSSGSNLSNKLKNDNFTEKELQKIAEALNCDYEATFTMRDTGKVI